jgi:PAS domain S-box-containing protein
MNLETYQNLLKELGDQKYALDQSAIVAITDAKGLITYVNEKFCEISGYSKDELIGQNHRIINSGYHDKEFFKNFWVTISQGKIWRGEICNRKKNKDIYWVNTTIVPFLDSQGHPYQYMAIRHEITELKELQQKIMEQQGQMIANSRLSAIGEMAATITHEINNPLLVILGRCEMIKNQLQQDKSLNIDLLNKNIEAIEKTGQRIERIVKSMKVLAHDGADEPFHQVRIQEIFDDVAELCTERFKNGSIQLTMEIETPEMIVNCRSHQIVQILVNLLNNAYDALENLPEKWIRLYACEKNGQILISITDSGLGIPPQILNKIFIPFFSTKKLQYGTGLGLSVSKSIMRQHKGDLIYDSHSPNTCFKLIFKS